jgi:hypothetical protein
MFVRVQTETIKNAVPTVNQQVHISQNLPQVDRVNIQGLQSGHKALREGKVSPKGKCDEDHSLAGTNYKQTQPATIISEPKAPRITQQTPARASAKD